MELATAEMWASVVGDAFPFWLVECAVWVVFWCLVFYALVFTEPYWCPSKSTKPHENCRYWTSRNMFGIIHAVFISAISVPAFFSLATASDIQRFASTDELVMCVLPDAFDPERRGFGEAVGLAGMAFTAFIVADLIVSVAHGMATLDYYVHHFAFAAAGFIVRGHCMLPYNAAILMGMEISTPFLNFAFMYLNRGVYKTAVLVSGLLFVILFIISRLLVNTYGAILLFVKREEAFPQSVPAWQEWFLIIAIFAGSAVQFFWFPKIIQSAMKAFGDSPKKEGLEEQLLEA
jgi:hypothetical protein